MAALFALLGGALLLYWPGMDGPLVLDDLINLKRLKHIGPVDDASTFLRFIFSSSSDYPVRPLSFASFLINDTSWPVHTEAHKYTNILIHLLNGVLVFWLALLICRFARCPEPTAALVALTCTALWLLSPLQVSTVLYIVQRMTQLSSMFVLAGLITYCYGRRRINEKPVAALSQMTFAVVVFGILGFLCKQNALLLTLYVLAAERALIGPNNPVHDPRTRKLFQLWKWIVLVIPVVVAFALIVHLTWDHYSGRSFTAFERIVSQPRILFEYLKDLIIPIREGMGVTHDDYTLSSGWLSPPTTLPAVLALAGLLAGALYASRKSASLFAFAVLWFLAGHLLESSFLALEPYFEHRNYLPAFGLYFALAWFVWAIPISINKYVRPALALYLASFVVVTYQNVDIWSNRMLMSEVWARDHPHSARAQQMRADIWSRVGNTARAHEILENIADQRRDTMASQLQYLLSGCRTEPEEVDRYLQLTKSRLDSTYFDHAVIPTLIQLKNSHLKRCPELSTEELLSLVDQVLQHESVRERRAAVADLLYVRATILARRSEVQNAVYNLHAAFNQNPTYDIGLTAVEFLYNLRQYSEALKVLDEIESIDLPTWHPDQFRGREIENWRRRLREKLESQTGDPSPTDADKQN